MLVQRRPEADPKFLVGRGKLDEILLRAMQLGAEVVIFDPDLTPGQARAISDATELKVIDRTMLILDIFAQHATSRDGKLQVELAQLRYTLPRLVEKNTMMSRLTAGPGGQAGIGGRGPGETKLEINRRRARERIQLLEKQLEELADDRRLRRQRRTERDVPIIAICGYTNAGKSTLLNALTEGDALAADKLFATLDPISRRLRFPHEREVVITDTVGFIRDLPKELVARVPRHARGDGGRRPARPRRRRRAIRIATSRSAPSRASSPTSASPTSRASWCGTRPTSSRPTTPSTSRSHGGGFVVSALDRATFGPLLLAIERTLWQQGQDTQIARAAHG